MYAEFDPGAKPTRLNVHRYWRAEFGAGPADRRSSPTASSRRRPTPCIPAQGQYPGVPRTPAADRLTPRSASSRRPVPAAAQFPRPSRSSRTSSRCSRRSRWRRTPTRTDGRTASPLVQRHPAPLRVAEVGADWRSQRSCSSTSAAPCTRLWAASLGVIGSSGRNRTGSAGSGSSRSSTRPPGSATRKAGERRPRPEPGRRGPARAPGATTSPSTCTVRRPGWPAVLSTSSRPPPHRRAAVRRGGRGPGRRPRWWGHPSARRTSPGWRSAPGPSPAAKRSTSIRSVPRKVTSAGAGVGLTEGADQPGLDGAEDFIVRHGPPAYDLRCCPRITDHQADQDHQHRGVDRDRRQLAQPDRGDHGAAPGVSSRIAVDTMDGPRVRTTRLLSECPRNCARPR